MPLTYKGTVKGNVVELPIEARLRDGSQVLVVAPDMTQSKEEEAWSALSAEAWEQDWTEEDADLVKEDCL